MAGSRVAKIELKTSAAGVDAGLSDASRKLRAFEREQSTAAKKAARDQAKADKDSQRALKRTGGRAASLAHGALMGLGAAAGFDIAGVLGDAAHSVFDTEKELTRLGIDANLSSSQIADFRQQITDTSNATGQSRLELVKAAHAYQILTGDAHGAIESTKLFAEVANASGASMEDIATAAASMRQNLALDPKEFRKGFDVLLNLGHKGALELRDFAGEMSGLAPQFKQFGGGDSVNQLTELGAALETVKLNFKDSAETATGLRAAMTAISKTKTADRLAAHGVDVWRIDPKTKQHVKRDFFDIIADIKKKIPDEKILADVLGGRQESFRAITAMLEHYDEMVKLRQEAANSDQVSVDAHKYMESASGKMAVAWEQVKNAIASALTPERVEAFANAMITAANVFVKAMGVAEEIWAGIHGERTKQEQENFEFQRRSNYNAGREGGDVGRGVTDVVQEDQLQHRLEAQAQGVDWVHAGDAAKYGATKDSHMYSPAEISAFAGQMGGASNFQSGLASAIAAAMIQAMKHVDVVVKADANAIAKVGKNAPINRGTQH